MNKFSPQRISDIQNYPRSAFTVDLNDIENFIDQDDVITKPDGDEGSDAEAEEDPADKRSDDFEKTHTLCAAFTVVSLVMLFMLEFLIMSIYLIISNGKRQISLYWPFAPLTTVKTKNFGSLFAINRRCKFNRAFTTYLLLLKYRKHSTV